MPQKTPPPKPTPPRKLTPRQTTNFKPPAAKPPPLQTTLSSSLTPKPPAASPTPSGWQSDSFSDYMREKQRKLRLQFSKHHHSKPPPSTLFQNIVIWIDGYTTPSRLHLTRLIASHSGRVETYFSREKVTHVICQTLAAATRKRLANIKALKIATPDWILESIRAGVRLNELDYPVSGMAAPPRNMFALPPRKGPHAKPGRP